MRRLIAFAALAAIASAQAPQTVPASLGERPGNVPMVLEEVPNQFLQGFGDLIQATTEKVRPELVVGMIHRNHPARRQVLFLGLQEFPHPLGAHG